MVVRFNESSVASLQEKALVKLQMFMLREKTDVLFIGSSRTQDGIEPRIIMQELAAINPNFSNIRVFNGASSKAGINKLTYTVNRALDKPGLQVLGIEVSDPQMRDRPWSLSYLPDTKPNNIEEYLQNKLSKYFYSIRYRKSFRLEGLLSIPLLYIADTNDGTKWFRRNTFVEPDANEVIDLTLNDEKFWDTRILRPKALTDEEFELIEGDEKYIAAYQSFAKKAKEKNVKLFFYAPVLTGEVMQKECTDAHLSTYQYLSTLTKTPVLMHACKNMRSDIFYADGSHLNEKSRASWSRNITRVFLHTLIDERAEVASAF